MGGRRGKNTAARPGAVVEPDTAGGKVRFGRHGLALITGALLLLTVVVFSGAFANQFLNCDDPANVTQNPYIRTLSWEAVKAWFTTPLLGMYSPLVYLSYAIDFRIGGLGPFVYHLTNLLLHLLNVALVLLVSFRLTRSAWASAIVSALFAVHSVNVAAVTPISVRSSLLSSCLYLSAYLAYLRHADRESGRWLWLSWLLFLLSALAKSATVVFPLLLLLTDWYWRRPLTRRRVLEKVPFFVVAAAFGIVGLVFREDTAAMARATEFALWERLFLAGYSLVHYASALVAPLHLSAYYPYPQRFGGHLPVLFFLAPVAIAVAAWVVVRAGAGRRLVIFGALFFLIHLLLVLKVVPLGAEWMADRYLYLPSIGVFLIVADLCCRSQLRIRKYALPAVAIAVAVLSVAAYRRNGAWKDDLTFYGDIIAKYPNASFAYSNRAAAKLKAGGDADSAISDCEQAIRLDPGYADALFNCATAKMIVHRHVEALRNIDAAITINPGRCEYYQLRADVKLKIADYRGAIADSDQAIALDPTRARAYIAYVSRGIAKFSLSDAEGALGDFNQAIALNPTDAVLFQNRANTRAMVGDIAGAMADYDSALALDPSFATVYYYRGLLKRKLGNASGGCDDLRTASRRGVAAAQALVSQACGGTR